MLKKILGVGAFKVIAALVAFLFNLFLARHLGSEQAGLFFLSLSVVMALAVLVRLGLDNVLLREVAGHWQLGVKGDVKGVWLQTLSLVFITSILVFVLAYIAAPWLVQELFEKPEMLLTLRWMLLGLPLFAVLFLASFAFQGVEKPAVLVFLQSFAYQFGLLLLLFLGVGRYATDYALYWFICVVVLGVGFSLFFTLKLRGEKASFVAASSLLKPAMPLWWMQVLTVIQNFGIPILLGALVAASELAWFYSAQKVAMLVSLVLMAVNIVVAPRFAALYKQDDMASIQSLAKKSVVMMLTLATPAIIFIWFFAEWLLGWFGSDFVAAGDALRIMALGQLVNVATGSVGYLLMMTHHEKRVSQTATLNAILIVVLGATLVPNYGMMGAAWAVAIPLAFGNLLNVYWVKKELGFNTLAVWKK